MGYVTEICNNQFAKCLYVPERLMNVFLSHLIFTTILTALLFLFRDRKLGLQKLEQVKELRALKLDRA